MSVSCAVRYKDDSIKSIPVAAEGEFTTHWERPSLELGLKYVPSFSDGLWIYDETTLTSVIDELLILKNYWESVDKNIATVQIQLVLERIDKVLVFLQAAQGNWDDIVRVFF